MNEPMTNIQIRIVGGPQHGEYGFWTGKKWIIIQPGLRPSIDLHAYRHLPSDTDNILAWHTLSDEAAWLTYLATL
jgi:hypothetical protein